MNIVIAGPKGSGKSTLAKLLGARLNIEVIETDTALEDLYEQETGTRLDCREICRTVGEPKFRAYEAQAVAAVAAQGWRILSTGGGTLMQPKLRKLLRDGSVLVLLQGAADKLWQRIESSGVPSYLDPEDPQTDFTDRVQTLYDVATPYADLLIDVNDRTPEEIAGELEEGLQEELAIRAQRFSHFGTILQVSTFGDSHGKGLGAILDGVPPGIPLTQEEVQKECDRRRPGQSGVTTSRQEGDGVQILSGVFEGKTTGAPIGMVIHNRDQDSSKYDNLRDLYRPGHADFSFWKKYGIRDHRGGGRSSGRETAGRVTCGAIAKKILEARGVQIRGFALEIAGVRCETVNLDIVESNPVRTADADAAEKMIAKIMQAKDEGDSVGGIIELHITGVPVGLGDPVFGKMDARLTHALVSLGAVKGVEIGDGFAVVTRRGSENNDTFRDGKPASNTAGGILGGISTGEEMILRAAIKPTPSISKPQEASTIEDKNINIQIEGRHDPCIIPRVIPVMESMCALVLLDAWMMQERLRGGDWSAQG